VEGRSFAELFAPFCAPGPERTTPNAEVTRVYAELGARYAEEMTKLGG